MGPLGSIMGPQGDSDSVSEVGSGTGGWGRGHTRLGVSLRV